MLNNMNSFEESLKLLRLENESVKEEIICNVNRIIQVRDEEETQHISNISYLSELCKYEQQVNHKLTEIKFDLLKFMNTNKLPVFETVKSNDDTGFSSIDDLSNIDIEKLKEISLRIIKKIDEYYVEDCNETKSPKEEISVETEKVESYPYISKDTLDELSEHTVSVLYRDIEHEGAHCEHFKDLKTRHHVMNEIMKSCNQKVPNSYEYETKVMEFVNPEKPELNQKVEGHITKIFDGNIIDCPIDLLENFIQKPELNREDLKNEVTNGNLLDLGDSVIESSLTELHEKYSKNINSYSSGSESEINEFTEDLNDMSQEKNEIPSAIENVQDAPKTEESVANDIGMETQSSYTRKKQNLTLEDKLKELGLENRFAIHERNRPHALLPDLHLQPRPISDTEKLRMIRNEDYVIKDWEAVKTYDLCVFSHIESPYEFYIQIFSEELKLLDSLNQLITEEFRGTPTPYRSKMETCEKIGRFCCAYVKEDKTYYRAEIVNWLFEKETKIVLVQLVDYGYLEYVHYKHLRKLSEELSYLPKIAVKCYLPLLYPPGSNRWKTLKKWPNSSVKALRELSGLTSTHIKPVFKICYVQNDEGSLGVDMYDIHDDSVSTIGELLINLGHAVQIVLPEDDPTGIINDEVDIQYLENCNNLNEVILGYDPKDESRICPFRRTRNGRCFKGDNCKLEHTNFVPGGYTSDKLYTYAWSKNEISFPKKGEYSRIKFTRALNAAHYYVNLILFENLLENLENKMNDNRNIVTYEKFQIFPAIGEIVIVKYFTKRWLRAKVRHLIMGDDGNCVAVQVFMVDQGDIIDVQLNDVRKIKSEFIELPFQAIECIFHDYQTRNDITEKDIDQFFHENMFHREFTARVMGVFDKLLCLKVFFRDEDIGEILVKLGFLIGTKPIFPSDSALMIPG